MGYARHLFKGRKLKPLQVFILAFPDQATIVALLIVLVILSQAVKIVREYERVVIFRLGRFSGVKGPGIFLIIPVIDRVMLLDLRVFTIDVAKQVVITKDNVSVEVDAVIYYRVVDPSRAIIQVENYKMATSLLAQTTLRDVLGQIELDDLLSKRDELNKKLQEILDRHTDPWGIKVTAVTLRDVSLPESMRRAIAKQAESEREKRSRIILADGELQASKTMADAARLYVEVPAALKLRELQTLVDIAREKTLIVVTPSGDVGTGSIAGLTAALNRELSEREEERVDEARKVALKDAAAEAARFRR
jgi:regulator of protease activity HflC (stomatin/prohibitin superfamily)